MRDPKTYAKILAKREDALDRASFDARRGANSSNATGIRGVSWHKRNRKYQARVILSGKTYHAGYFDTLEEAEAAVIAKRRGLFTHDDYEDWAASA